MKRAEEVRRGEGAEQGVLAKWLRKSARAKDVVHTMKSLPYSDYDYVLLNRDRMVVGYLEIKTRRSPIGKYGDAIFPWRKHEVAARDAGIHGLPFIAVTEYGDGVLVEVDLTKRPARLQNIQRRDRRNEPAVPHAVYEGKQIRVLR